MTKRGGLFTVSLSGDYGKPRPALVIQNDLLDELDSVVLCPVTSDMRTADFRITVEPTPSNGLRQTSQVMVDTRLSWDCVRNGHRKMTAGWGMPLKPIDLPDSR